MRENIFLLNIINNDEKVIQLIKEKNKENIIIKNEIIEYDKVYFDKKNYKNLLEKIIKLNFKINTNIFLDGYNSSNDGNFINIIKFLYEELIWKQYYFEISLAYFDNDSLFKKEDVSPFDNNYLGINFLRYESYDSLKFSLLNSKDLIESHHLVLSIKILIENQLFYINIINIINELFEGFQIDDNDNQILNMNNYLYNLYFNKDIWKLNTNEICNFLNNNLYYYITNFNLDFEENSLNLWRSSYNYKLLKPIKTLSKNFSKYFDEYSLNLIKKNNEDNYSESLFKNQSIINKILITNSKPNSILNSELSKITEILEISEVSDNLNSSSEMFENKYLNLVGNIEKFNNFINNENINLQDYNKNYNLINKENRELRKQNKELEDTITLLKYQLENKEKEILNKTETILDSLKNPTIKYKINNENLQNYYLKYRDKAQFNPNISKYISISTILNKYHSAIKIQKFFKTITYRKKLKIKFNTWTQAKKIKILMGKDILNNLQIQISNKIKIIENKIIN